MKVQETEDDVNIELIYYRPNTNINQYKYKKITDYYICSSHRSFLIGHQHLDYCSEEMIKRVLYYGALFRIRNI